MSKALRIIRDAIHAATRVMSAVFKRVVRPLFAIVRRISAVARSLVARLTAVVHRVMATIRAAANSSRGQVGRFFWWLWSGVSRPARALWSGAKAAARIVRQRVRVFTAPIRAAAVTSRQRGHDMAERVRVRRRSVAASARAAVQATRDRVRRHR